MPKRSKDNKRQLFKIPLTHSAFRLSEDERKVWQEAADKRGVSLNDFLRHALRHEVDAVVGAKSQIKQEESTELLRQILEAIKELKR